jgi:hypothetical protein
MTAQTRTIALRPRDLASPPKDNDKPWRCTRCGSNCWIDPTRRLLALNGAKAVCYRCLYPDPIVSLAPGQAHDALATRTG